MWMHVSPRLGFFRRQPSAAPSFSVHPTTATSSFFVSSLSMFNNPLQSHWKPQLQYFNER
jgi:hypothetical protein